ncbi:MAG TPA: chemotaxis-specific protein-glutamate methyltransferase CheB [Myxococcota bacterium]|nr:chemotaxis-specific protein-glutamate methyltransferase CheB [Myxococcota bacterium]
MANTEGLIRVLVIDDSAFSRRTITRMLETSPLVRVVDVARDGEEALRKTFELKPDLITLDLEMPRMDGFTFLRLVMSKQPTPVMVISGRSGEQELFRALDLGAVDFIVKPTARATLELESIQAELIRKVHALRELRIEKVRQRISATPPLVTSAAPSALSRSRVVAIGCSTGGPAAIMRIFGSMVEPPPAAMILSQHMPEGFTKGFAERVDRLTPVRTREAADGDELRPGTMLIAPGGCHVEFEYERGRTVTRLVPKQPSDKYTPSVDRMLTSAAKQYGPDLMAVVLTGMGDDGRRGVVAVKQAGGTVIAESEETAVIFGMPQQAIRTGVVDAVLPLDAMAIAIQSGLAPLKGAGPRTERKA